MDAADRFRTCEVLSIYASRDADAVPDAVRALPNLRALSLGPTVRTPTWLAGFSRLVELELARAVGEMPPLPATLRILRHGDGPPDLDHVRGLPHLAELDIGDHRWRPCPMWLDELRLRAFAATNVSIPAFAEALRGMPLVRLKLVRAVPPPQSGLEGDASENNRALDRALADPRALRALDLQGYPLAPFPDVVRGLVQLRELTLRDAGLQSLPAWLAELRSLVLLVVAGNADVVSLPPALAAITTLRILDLGTETCGQVGFSWLSSWLAQERPDLHIFEDFYYH